MADEEQRQLSIFECETPIVAQVASAIARDKVSGMRMDPPRYPDAPGYSNPTTSKDTAKGMGEGHGKRCARLLSELQVRGSFGATCDELEQALGMLHQTTSAGLRHLVLSGKAVDSGTKRKTRSGRGAIVWHAKEGWR